MSRGLLILGNQLFDPQQLKKYGIDHVFMREDHELCSYFKFHKLKIVFFLSAMRFYRDELRDHGYTVTYQELNLPEKNSQKRYEDHLIAWLKKTSIQKLYIFEIEDHFFSERILKALNLASVEFEILESPMFLTSRNQFKAYLSKTKRPFMKTFYESQRRRLAVLVDAGGKPQGGQWSYDEMNRKSLPQEVNPPMPPLFNAERKGKSQKILNEVCEVCRRIFSNHPGELKEVWFPLDRLGARAWLQDFVENRLSEFGPYEDALTKRSDFVFHSGLSPFLNTGLLTPDEILKVVIAAGKRRKIPLSSLEGFIRQLIGWREFVRGIYQNFHTVEEERNFWNHHRKLNSCWYDGTTGIAPLDHVIRKVLRLGYAHHIERLMVVSNFMLLLEIHPEQAHRWFMEMFIDSSDWVMGPNVFGMGIFSDGGIFATKPYFCGSNYYRKMGDYEPGDWQDGVDGLYWGFIEKNHEYFSKNPRLSMMVHLLKKIEKSRKNKIYDAAEKMRARLTFN